MWKIQRVQVEREVSAGGNTKDALKVVAGKLTHTIPRSGLQDSIFQAKKVVSASPVTGEELEIRGVGISFAKPRDA